MAELSLSMIFFIVCILVPGYILIGISAKERPPGTSFWDAALRGSVAFAVAFLGAFVLRLWQGRPLFDEFLRAAANLAKDSGPQAGDLLALFKMFSLTYLLAVGIGLADLAFAASPRLQKRVWEAKMLALRRLRGFPKEAELRRFEASSDVPFLAAMLAYRRAGKRPYLKIFLKDGKSFEGECLRYSWGGDGALLVRDADDPGKLEEIPLDSLARVEFLNLFALAKEAAPCRKRRLLSRRDAFLLDSILPGLADEVEREIAERMIGD